MNWLDMLIYKLFYWRFNPIMQRRPDILELFTRHLDKWHAQQEAKRLKEWRAGLRTVTPARSEGEKE